MPCCKLYLSSNVSIKSSAYPTQSRLNSPIASLPVVLADLIFVFHTQEFDRLDFTLFQKDTHDEVHEQVI